MGNSAGINNVAATVSPSINNCLVTLCTVRQDFGFIYDERHMLSVLAVLKRHNFEIKPVAFGNVPIFLCELREGVPPWPSPTLDRAMTDALPGYNPNYPVRWNFA